MFTGVIGPGIADEAHALGAVRQGFDGDLACIFAKVGVGGADIEDALGIGRVAVEREQRHLRADLVEGFDLRFRVEGRYRDRSGARCNQIFHQALLDGSVSALRIFSTEDRNSAALCACACRLRRASRN
jgi:hypothetical protein